MNAVFDSIQGQVAAVEFLTAALASDRLPHALLFTGPRGVGKRTTALLLASIFLTRDPANSQQLAETRRHVFANTHSDFHLVTRDLARLHDKTGKSKAVDFSISVVRKEIVEPASKKSTMGVGKVFVAREVELMNAGAQNALLKTLEEPQGRTLIVLTTDSPGSMLPTIRSRCQVVRFGAPSIEECINVLKRIDVLKRTVGGDVRQLEAATKLAAGSPGLAMDWLERGMVSTAAELIRLVDSGSASDLQQFLKAASEDYAKRELTRDELASEDAARRSGLQVLLRLAADHIRARLPQSVSMEAECVRVDALARAERYLDMNVNLALILQQLASAVANAISSPRG